MPKPPHEVDPWVADMYALVERFEALARNGPSDKCFGPSSWELHSFSLDPSPETPAERVKRQRLEREAEAADRAAEVYLQRHNTDLRAARSRAGTLWNYSELRPTTRALQSLMDDTEAVPDLLHVGAFYGRDGAETKYKGLAKRWDEEANRRSGRMRQSLRLRP